MRKLTRSVRSDFYLRDAAEARVLAMAQVALCVCLSVTSQCSIENAAWIELVFGTEASSDLSYTLL